MFKVLVIQRNAQKVELAFDTIDKAVNYMNKIFFDRYIKSCKPLNF